MAKKDYDTQVKKFGKINDNFICLPDPEDCYVWYYVVFGLEMEGFKGGYYLGKITCPPDYPAKAPNIRMITENGRLHTTDSICMSISDMHPESWNPAWKVNQIVCGLLSMWLGDTEGTYGTVYESNYNLRAKKMSFTDKRMELAMASREFTKNHEKFKIFEAYADVIGINKVPEVPEWAEFTKRMEQNDEKAKEEKRLKEEKAKKEAEEKARAEEEKKLAEEKKLKEEQEKKQNEEKQKRLKLQVDYFRQI